MAEFMKRSASRLAAWWLRPSAPHAVPLSIHGLLWGLLLSANLLRLGTKWLVDDHAAWSWPLMLTDLALTVLTYAALFYFTWRVIVPRHLHRPVRLLLVLLLTVAAIGLIRLTTNKALGLAPAAKPVKVDMSLYDASPVESFMNGLREGYRAGAEEARNPAATIRAGATTGKNILPATLMVLLLGIYLRLAHDHQHEQRRREEAEQRRQEAERQQLAAELSLLKAQINPHFLFNTLNNIYSLATADDVEAPAATAVLQLSDLMRYQLYEAGTDTVPLHKEVTHLRNLLSLQLLRLPGAGPEQLPFRVAPELAASNLPIAPMMLLPLLENAFKHGDLQARPHVVELELTYENQELRFVVQNRRRAPRPGPPQPGGVGLANLRRRLQLLYPRHYGLHLHETEDTYRATLTLLLPAAPASLAAAPRAAALTPA